MRSRPRLDELLPRRVCLIKPSSLGDVVHATPVFAALRSRWPNARFAWVVNSNLAALVDGLDGLDEVIRFDRTRAGKGPWGALEFARFLASLRRRRFDLAIDLQGLLRSAVMACATAASVRVGMSSAREGARHFYTHRVDISEQTTHAVDKMLAVAHAFGASSKDARFLVATSGRDHQFAHESLASLPRPRLILNVGARWATKRWPPESFARVARMANERLGASLAAVGAPEDQPLVDALKRALGPVPLLDLCGRTTLPQLAALAQQGDAFLSNDTGPLHLAAAMGTRTVGIYLCTDPAKTGPYGAHAIAVGTHIWCAASLLKKCSRLECMSEVTADRVWEAVADQLAAAANSAVVAHSI